MIMDLLMTKSVQNVWRPKKGPRLWWLITLTEHPLRLPTITLGKKVEMSEEKKQGMVYTLQIL